LRASFAKHATTSAANAPVARFLGFTACSRGPSLSHPLVLFWTKSNPDARSPLPTTPPLRYSGNNDFYTLGLTFPASYRFKVRARNTHGFGEDSTEVTVTLDDNGDLGNFVSS